MDVFLLIYLLLGGLMYSITMHHAFYVFVDFSVQDCLLFTVFLNPTHLSSWLSGDTL